jgi:pSer/pThr/pTyr-binding forkhead associated (FHA) protein
VDIEGRPLTIGRAPDNGLVVLDGRASRHHARVDLRRGSLVLTDLGSTNGSWVNDRRVESVALGEGDRIRIGTTTLVVESVEAGRRPIEAREAHHVRSDAAGEGPVGPDDAAPAS